MIRLHRVAAKEREEIKGMTKQRMKRRRQRRRAQAFRRSPQLVGGSMILQSGLVSPDVPHSWLVVVL